MSWLVCDEKGLWVLLIFGLEKKQVVLNLLVANLDLLKKALGRLIVNITIFTTIFTGLPLGPCLVKLIFVITTCFTGSGIILMV